MTDLGLCNEPGPWGATCTDYLGHQYSHYDAAKDRSWQDDWRDTTAPSGGGTEQEGTE